MDEYRSSHWSVFLYQCNRSTVTNRVEEHKQKWRFFRILYVVDCIRQQVLISYLLSIFNNTIISEKILFDGVWTTIRNWKETMEICFKLNSNLVAFIFKTLISFTMGSLAIYLDMCLSFSHYHISTIATEFLVTAMDVIYV